MNARLANSDRFLVGVVAVLLAGVTLGPASADEIQRRSSDDVWRSIERASRTRSNRSWSGDTVVPPDSCHYAPVEFRAETVTAPRPRFFDHVAVEALSQSSLASIRATGEEREDTEKAASLFDNEDGDGEPLEPLVHSHYAPVARPSQTVVRRPLDYQARVRGGGSYFDNSADGIGQSRLGGAFGVDAVAPLAGELGGYAGFQINGFEDGAQLLGTVGIVKGIRPATAILPGGPFDEGSAWSNATRRLSYSVLYDQFTDTRIDPLRLARLRTSVSYNVDPNWAVGAIYSIPTEDDDVTVVTPNLRILVPLEVSEEVGVHVTGYVDDRTLVSAAVAWLDDLDSVRYSATVRSRASRRATTFASTEYQDREAGPVWRESNSGSDPESAGEARPAAARVGVKPATPRLRRFCWRNTATTS